MVNDMDGMISSELIRGLNAQFSKDGYNYVIFDHAQKLAQYKNIYRGNINNFTVYKRFLNGRNREFTRPSAQVIKRISEMISNLVFSDNFSITCEKNVDLLTEILDYNNFYQHMPIFFSKILGYAGSGYLIQFKDQYGKAAIDFVDAQNALMLEHNNSRVTSILTVSPFTINYGDKKGVYNIVCQHIEAGDDYIVKNRIFKSKNGKDLGAEVEIKDLPKEFRVESEVIYSNSTPRFQLINSTSANNHDVNNILGLPVSANCIDYVKKLDSILEAMDDELNNKRARVLVSRDAMKTTTEADANGNLRTVDYFDPADTLIHAVNIDSTSLDKSPIKEISTSDFRMSQLISAYEFTMAEISVSCGLSSSTFKQTSSVSRVTASAIITERGQTFMTKMTNERMLVSAFTRMVKAIGEIEGIDFGEIKVSFFDSLMSSDDDKFKTNTELLKSGAIPKWYYVMNALKISRSEAELLVKENAEENVMLEKIVGDIYDDDVEVEVEQEPTE